MKHILLIGLLVLALVSVASAAQIMANTSGNSDGYVDRDSVNENLSTIRAGAGTYVSTTATTGAVRLSSSGTSNQFSELNRAYYQFDSSAVPDGAPVTSAVVYLYGNTIANTFNDAASVGLYSFVPITYGTAVAGDYGNGGTTALSNTITNTSLTTSGYNAFTINNLTYINKTGWTAFTVKTSWDASGSGPTWIGSKVCSIYFETVESTGTAKDPYMLVDYAVTPTAAFTLSETSGISPKSITFTDTSTNSPTSWAWYYNNLGAGDVLFSTSQNPTQSFTSGYYDVKLKSTNAAGSDWENQTQRFLIGTVPVASFTSDVTSGKAPFTVQFTDTSTGYPAMSDWDWDFGDGNTSTSQNPTNVYSTYGKYTVSLSVRNSGIGTDLENKTNYITVRRVDPLPQTTYAQRYLNPFMDNWGNISALTPILISAFGDPIGNNAATNDGYGSSIIVGVLVIVVLGAIWIRTESALIPMFLYVILSGVFLMVPGVFPPEWSTWLVLLLLIDIGGIIYLLIRRS